MLESSMKAIFENYKFHSFVKEATCFKNQGNPSCIDLILVNKHLRFQRLCALEARLSDLHKILLTVMKTHKKKPRIILFREYKNFLNEIWSLQHEVGKPRENLYENGLDALSKICTDVPKKHAPCKNRYLSANHKSFIISEIQKGTMRRARLRNCFLERTSDENRQLFCKQRNECVSLLQIGKKDYLTSLNEKLITENKLSWETVSLSCQVRYNL